MSKTTLIIISGPPAVGKTTLGKFLAAKIKLPYFYKDQFKEAMYDHIEHPKSLELHGKMGSLAYFNLQTITTELLTKGISHVIEGPFDDKYFTPFLLNLKNQVKFDIVQLQLECDGKILIDRFLARQKEGRCHTGHDGEKFFDSLKEKLKVGKMKHLSIDSKKIVIDTTNFNEVSYHNIYEELKKLI